MSPQFINRNWWYGGAAAIAALLVGVGAIAFAQPATPEQRGTVEPKPNYGTLHMQTRLGGARLIDGEGRVQIDFVGTMLLSQVEGDVQSSGNLKVEYQNDERKRTVYNGAGRVVVQGKWRAIQWFGRDLNAVWYGRGRARIQGEFDRELKTGSYWYDDPNVRLPFPSNSTLDIDVPNLTPGRQNRDIQPTGG